MKLYRTPTKGYDSFTVVYYDADRRQHRRTFSDPVTAEQEAQIIAAQLASGEQRPCVVGDLKKVPKEACKLTQSSCIILESMMRNVDTVAFIQGTPGIWTQQIEIPGDKFYMETGMCRAYGPIKSVTNECIVADFSETELIGVEGQMPEKFPSRRLGGARSLKGMSGSGLWVYADSAFALAGIMCGPVRGSDRATSHLIRFTPVWVLRDWVNEVEQRRQKTGDASRTEKTF